MVCGVYSADETIEIDSSLYVLATSSKLDNRTRVLKHNDTFTVFDWGGEIGAISNSPHGLYYMGTRHLSAWKIFVANARPLLLNSTIREDNSILMVDHTTPDIILDERPILTKGTLHIRREIRIEDDSLFEVLHLSNYSCGVLSFSYGYQFDADFGDIFEVRGVHRNSRGKRREREINTQEIRFKYQGHDNIDRVTQIRFDQLPQCLDCNSASFQIKLAPGERHTLTTEISCDNTEPNLLGKISRMSAYQTGHDPKADPSVSVETDNEAFNEWIDQSTADLKMLTSSTKYGPYPYAGVPWFATPFGRDGIITALQTLWVQPDLARGVLSFLAATQADHHDPINEAQPGKILHEMRAGEMAALGEIPYQRYYGTVDATPLFIVLAGRYMERTGDISFIAEIWKNIELACQWIETYGDQDGDGFIEYARSTDTGLLHQGWKDSSDCLFDEFGTEARAPIALCEVQSYVYEAYLMAAVLAEHLDKKDQAQQWRSAADLIKLKFDTFFWDESLGTYGMALDGNKKLCRVRSSNAAHALFSGIALPERAKSIAASLTCAQAFNGWGLRTVYEGEPRYNPMSYHNGSVWPHDTAMAVFGLARYGCMGAALSLMTGLFDASTFTDLSRLPELFCGFERLPGQAPTHYPVACIPQAWASGAVFMCLQACLGINFSCNTPAIRFNRPRLPHNINKLKIRNMRYGHEAVDLVLCRRGDDVALHTEKREGNLAVLVSI
jgi:glycogen debranching enzyme